MAFTDTQKDQIRKYLGYPAGYYQYNTPLEGMMDKVGGIAVEQASVEAILTELATVDAALADSGTTTTVSGALKRADDIEFYPAGSSSTMGAIGAMNRGRMLVERLRQRFGVEIMGDYFGTPTKRSFALTLG
jgi:hypothetical protein